MWAVMNAPATSPAVKASASERPYFAALDGFRGILALVVAMYHTIWLSHPNTSAFFNNGPVIIDLFFAFSGFLMFTLYRSHMDTAAQAKSFMVKRFARLYPLHLFMLAVFVAFAVFRIWAHKVGLASYEPGEILPFEAGASESWRNLFAHLTMTHAMGGADALTYNPPSWTIGAEFYTYILFVGFMLFGRPKWVDRLVLPLGIVAIYVYLALNYANMNITYEDGFLRCVAGFFIGVVAAKLILNNVIAGFFERLSSLQASVLEWVAVIGSTLFVIYCGGKMQFFVAPVLLLFVLVFSQDKGVISRFLDQKLFAYLAKISYSVYMTHVIISIGFTVVAERFIAGLWPNWNEAGLGGDLLMVPYLLVVIVVSHFTYHYVEVTGGRWISCAFKREKPKLSPAKTSV